MSYGAILTDDNGVPFYIDGTMPLTLLERRDIIPTGSDSRTLLYPNDGAIRFVFINSNVDQNSVGASGLLLTNGNWYLRSSNSGSVVSVYIFGYKFQPVPSWGIQINDAQGRCILTNESKVLRDLRQLGDSNNPNNSGYLLDVTLPGAWAVAPAMTGYFAGVVNQGNQPRPVVAAFYTDARYNGSTTRIKSGAIGNLEGGVSNATYSNYRNTITAIDVSRY